MTNVSVLSSTGETLKYQTSATCKGLIIDLLLTSVAPSLVFEFLVE